MLLHEQLDIIVFMYFINTNDCMSHCVTYYILLVVNACVDKGSLSKYLVDATAFFETKFVVLVYLIVFEPALRKDAVPVTLRCFFFFYVAELLSVLNRGGL